MANTWRQLSEVFKLRIGFAITLCSLAGMAVTPGAALAPSQILVLALAVFLSSAASGAFNQYAERDLDARMARTCNRPFVTGAIRARPYWPIALCLVLLVAVGTASWVLNAHAAVYIFLGAFVYGIVYTIWLKRRSVWNIVVGGSAGSFAVLAGAAAVSPDLAPVPIILAIVLFLWTPPHFWSLAMALKKDYAAAQVPMLPVVTGDARAALIILINAAIVVIISLLPMGLGMGAIYLAGAIVGGGLFIKRSIELIREPSPEAAMANFRASLVQLGLLLTTAIVDRWFFHSLAKHSPLWG